MITIKAYPSEPDFEEKLALINALHPSAVPEWYRGTINRRIGEETKPVLVTLKRVIFKNPQAASPRAAQFYKHVSIRPRYSHEREVVLGCDGYRYPAGEIDCVMVEIQAYDWTRA